MTDKLLITAQEVLDFVGVSENIQEDYLTPHIRNQQQIEIRQLLGTPLFNAVISDVENDTLSGHNETLVEHLKPALSYYVMATAFYDLTYKVTRKGIIKLLDDGAESPSDAMIAMKAKQYRDTATSFANDLIEWLEDNQVNYPLYRSDDTTSTSKRTGSSIFTGYNKKTRRF